MNSTDLRTQYQRYIAVCNAREFEALSDFVAADVIASETAAGRDAYVAGLRDVVTGFTDFRWEVQHLLVDGSWLAARLVSAGTHTGTFRGIAATGRFVSVQELAMYSTRDGKITHCWGDLGSTLRDELVSGAGD
ncbi:ester cyclase [Gordonia terrae]|uniref:ester cyclase n=1 Tax=Gordonia terrae TaxID=2055 RepID=UPI003F6CB584